jgi:hypothetical protein
VGIGAWLVLRVVAYFDAELPGTFRPTFRLFAFAEL